MDTNEVKALLLMHPRTGRVMTESEWAGYCAESNTVFDKDNYVVVEWNPMTGEYEPAEEMALTERSVSNSLHG